LETFCFLFADLALTLARGVFAFLPLAFAPTRPAFRPAALVLAPEVFAFARRDFGLFAASLVGFRFAAGFALERGFRDGAGLAAALTRLVVFAMVLASIPPSGTACGHHLRAAARLQFKRGF
jgi:hypothetical protein